MTDEERRAYNRAYYLANREKIKERVKRRAIAKADEISVYQRDYRKQNAAALQRYREENRDKHRKTYASWYAANAETKRQYAKDWRLANIEHARARNRLYMADYTRRPENRQRIRDHGRLREARERGATGKATPHQVEARRAYYGYRCAYCASPDATTIDHVIPIARGGTNWPANLRPACHSCNSSKRDRPLAAFLSERK